MSLKNLERIWKISIKFEKVRKISKEFEKFSIEFEKCRKTSKKASKEFEKVWKIFERVEIYKKSLKMSRKKFQ